MKNKKGLSTIVTTLIIILLVLVAIGIIWSVVKGLLDDSRDDISNSKKCLDIEFSVSSLDTRDVNETTALTLRRSPSGIDDEVGVKVMLYSSDTNTQLQYFGGEDAPIEFGMGDVQTADVNTSTIQNDDVTQVDLIPYFIDEAGSEVVCQTVTTKNY